jgi:hypothetical protein
LINSTDAGVAKPLPRIEASLDLLREVGCTTCAKCLVLAEPCSFGKVDAIQVCGSPITVVSVCDVLAEQAEPSAFDWQRLRNE